MNSPWDNIDFIDVNSTINNNRAVGTEHTAFDRKVVENPYHPTPFTKWDNIDLTGDDPAINNNTAVGTEHTVFDRAIEEEIDNELPEVEPPIDAPIERYIAAKKIADEMEKDILTKDSELMNDGNYTLPPINNDTAVSTEHSAFDRDEDDTANIPLGAFRTPLAEPSLIVLTTPLGNYIDSVSDDMDLIDDDPAIADTEVKAKHAIRTPHNDRNTRLKNRFLKIEGIDKIKVVLNPTQLTPNSTKKHIDPQNRLTLHTTGPVKALSIHAEYMNPLEDMRIIMAKALYELIQKDVIQFSYNITDPQQIVSFIAQNLDLYISSVQELEFFFNFKTTDIHVNQDSVDKGHLIQYIDKKTNTPEDTYYTADYRIHKRRSSGTIYDKGKKDLHDRHSSYTEIMNNPYKQRLEFRLCSNNSPYRGLKNLRGTYNDIIKRYIPLLAIIYNNYLRGHVETSSSDHKQFKKIRKEAEKGRVRYTGNLKK